MESGEQNIVITNSHVRAPSAWLNHGVPFLFAEDSMSRHEDLTLAPGSNVIFAQNGKMIVSEEGSLNAVGTREDPITFTSTTEVAGYWRGISFASSSSCRQRKGEEKCPTRDLIPWCQAVSWTEGPAETIDVSTLFRKVFGRKYFIDTKVVFN
jgi:hypothetical protein